jgi:hypothetical protein
MWALFAAADESEIDVVNGAVCIGNLVCGSCDGR